MKKLLLALALLFAPSVAWAQCNGVFPANYACGTTSASSALPHAVPISSFTLQLIPGSTVIAPSTNLGVLFDNNGVLGDSTTINSITVVSGTISRSVIQTPTVSGGTFTLPSFVFATGANSTITGTSNNTGFLNEIIIDNQGTPSNASTQAAIAVTLSTSASTSGIWSITGGSSPFVNIASGVGATGGVVINTGAGPLALTPATKTIIGALSDPQNVVSTTASVVGSFAIASGGSLYILNGANNSAGGIAFNGSDFLSTWPFAPSANNAINLGESSLRWANVFSVLSNVSSFSTVNGVSQANGDALSVGGSLGVQTGVASDGLKIYAAGQTINFGTIRFDATNGFTTTWPFVPATASGINLGSSTLPWTTANVSIYIYGQHSDTGSSRDAPAVIDFGNGTQSDSSATLQMSSFFISGTPKFNVFTTGAGTQTFTNSPCSALTTERWIKVTFAGSTSQFFIPSCS